MKKNFIFSLLCFYSALAFSQTRESDYNYIINHYLNDEENSEYSLKEITNSNFPKSPEINSTLQFVLFTTNKDNKGRGIAVIYKEKKKTTNEIIRLIAICLPAENSENLVINKAFKDLNAITDPFILKYILSGVIRIGIKTK